MACYSTKRTVKKPHEAVSHSLHLQTYMTKILGIGEDLADSVISQLHKTPFRIGAQKVPLPTGGWTSLRKLSLVILFILCLTTMQFYYQLPGISAYKHLTLFRKLTKGRKVFQSYTVDFKIKS